MKLRPIILTITLYVVIHLAIAGPTCTSEDAAVMVKLQKSLSPSGWSGNNPCEWNYVQCDQTGHVINITLDNKNLWGEVPSEITRLSRLESLNLQYNHIYGKLPPLVDLPALEKVLLNDNNFTSFPSPFLKGLKNLQKLNISNNRGLPPWELPHTLLDSTTLVALSLVNTNLKGQIPDIFESLASLQTLKLSYNNLTGPLPQSLSKSAMKILWLNDQAQGLNGTLEVLANMTNLSQVWLQQNLFEGPIPNLSASKSLFDLQLHSNRLTGPLPSSITTLPKLVNISLGSNLLQGPRPVFASNVSAKLELNNFCLTDPGPCDSQVTTLIDIIGGFGYPATFSDNWTGNDPCHPEFPWQSVTCDDNSQVTVLNFAKQDFYGHISPSIANLTSLEIVLLNNNKLTGTIPPGLANLTYLRVFDISNNNISGHVPNFEYGVLVNTSGNSFIGKDIVIPAPAPASAPDPNKSWTDKVKNGYIGKGSDWALKKDHKYKDKQTNTWLIAIVATVLAIFVAALSFVIFLQFRRIRGRQEILAMHTRNGRDTSHKCTERVLEPVNRSSGVCSDIQFEGGNVSVPIEVLRDVTNNFSKINELGRGGFGVVYEGVLHDGTKIAVKRMEASVDSSKGLSEFQAEIAVLSKVRHRNLVALYGFCIHGNERLLVYEHMPQGTLGKQLFMHKEIGVVPLTWKQRIQIALDVAKGVEYLHSLAHQSFIHRDLKPSNVLLGDDMRAKVSDFGLVKNAPDGKYSVETKLAGTFGYLAPEYASTGRVTTKIDVFSFGVILMELITGRKALDESLPDDKSHLVAWFRKHINHKDSIRTMLDTSLSPDDETFESIYKVVELSGHCTAREPLQRPDMGHAVNILSPLVEQWKPTRSDSLEIDLEVSLPQALQRWQANDENSSALSSGYHNSYKMGSLGRVHSSFRKHLY